MKRIIAMRSLAVLSALLAAVVVHGQDIVMIGDSLSDNGNGYAANAKLVLQTNETYPQAPYYEGRWSNGPVWLEVAASQLGVGLTDYGAGGATSGVVPAQVPPLQPPFAGLTLPTTVLSPNIYQQLNSLLLATNNTLDPNSYYMVFIGGNDFFATVFANTTNTAQDTFDNIQAVVSELYDHGARKFILVSVPGLSVLPVFTQPATYGFYDMAKVQNVDTLGMSLNSLLQSFVGSIPSSYPGATATLFDYPSALMRFLMNAQAYGVTNMMEACYLTAPDLSQNSVPSAQPIGAAGGQLCSNPDAHLFWDQFHLTRVPNEFIGATFVQQYGQSLFGKAGAPAPSQAAGQAPQLPPLPMLSTAASG